MAQPFAIERNPWTGVRSGFELGNALRQDQAEQRAGNALRSNDYGAAAGALFDAGMLKEGAGVQDLAAARATAAKTAADKQRDDALKFTADAAARLRRIYDMTPEPLRKERVLGAFDQIAPTFRRFGESDEELAQTRQLLDHDPEGTLTLLGAEAAKAAGYDVRNAGDEVLVIDKGTGQLVSRFRGGRTLNVPEGGALYELPGTDGATPAPSQAAPPTAERVRAVVDGLVSSGARITSARRTPQHNAEVGGAPNSYHLRGQAFDIAPPPGMSMADLEAQLRSTGVQFAELINEGDHVHIAWNNEGQPKPAEAPAARPGGARLVVERPKPQEQWVDLPGGGQRNTLTGETKNVPRASGRLSASALNQQNQHLEALQTSSAINTRLARVVNLLDSGKLDLGLAKNIVARGQNALGVSSDASRAYASFRADLEKLRNDSLRLNKGVQTEGDAQRAWNELVANLNDPDVVRRRLEEIQAYNRQAIAFHEDMVAQIREDSGMAPIDVKKFEAKPLDIRGRSGGATRPPLTSFQR